jgi:hypothetical protein
MNTPPDPRIPLLITTDAPPKRAPTDACLREGRGADAPNQTWFQPPPAAAHAPGCACCPPRNPAGIAIAALLFAAARAQAPPFQRLVAITTSQAGADAVRHALAHDPLVKARFRPA